MRRLFLSALMLAFSTALFAQNFSDITKDLGSQKFEDAKVKIDKIMADAKNHGKPEGWFYKAKVYNALAVQKNDSTMLEDALFAMKKYFELEGQNKDEKKRYLHSLLENHATAFDVRSNFVNRGVKAY